MKKISVLTNKKKYPIYIGDELIKKIDKILKKESLSSNNCLIIYDSKVPRNKLEIIKKKCPYKKKIFFKFVASEENKNFEFVKRVINILLKNSFSRNDCIIGVGGGILGDLACFTASIYKRGIKFINIPTTLLAQVDASIGGKNGVNHKFYGKNLIGTFNQPDIVISDISFLNTLKKREILCGYAEILKHSLISNYKNFKYLKKNFTKILSLKTPEIVDTITWSCSIKKKIVEKDELENNFRRVLNLGHTFGHAYEASVGFKKKLNHGEGVILGLKSAAKFSLNEKLLSNKNYKLINDHIDELGFKLNLKDFFNKNNVNKIISFMRNDKKNLSSKISLVLLNKIGKPVIDKTYSSEKIKMFLNKELINL